MAANGYSIQLSSAGVATPMITLLLPLLISMSSGVGSLIMMSKQRDAELALSGIVGATPAQRIAMPILEAVIITITGAILGVMMAAIALGFLAIGFPAAGFIFAYSPNYLIFAMTLAVALLITVSATVLPTLRGLRMPESRMIARLVAE